MLVLWDIDGTLLDTKGTGPEAFRHTARDFFEADLPELSFGGATDSGLLRQLSDHFERPALNAVEFESFIDAYVERMRQGMNRPDFAGSTFDSAVRLFDELAKEEHVHQSLLTGNARRGAEAKLEHFSLWSRLDHEGGAYGDDHHERNHLGPIAMERVKQRTGREFASKEVLIIGDTRRDIECANAISARCLAVSTGWTSNEELRAGGAWRVCEDLSEISVADLLV